MSAWEVNKLVQDIVRDKELAAAFKRDEDSVLRRYTLTDDEIEGLKACEPPKLSAIGMHPILQIWYLLLKNEDAARHVTVKEYVQDL